MLRIQHTRGWNAQLQRPCASPSEAFDAVFSVPHFKDVDATDTNHMDGAQQQFSYVMRTDTTPVTLILGNGSRVDVPLHAIQGSAVLLSILDTLNVTDRSPHTFSLPPTLDSQIVQDWVSATPSNAHVASHAKCIAKCLEVRHYTAMNTSVPQKKQISANYSCRASQSNT